MAKFNSHINKESKNLYLARALYDAVEDCNIQQVNTLLFQKKANPSIFIPEEGMTPFHLAAGHENLAFSKVAIILFLHNKADPNIRCEGNRTVLHIAVAWNRSEIVKVLLQSPYHIPNLYIKDDDGLSVFNYAVKFNAWESLAILQSHLKQSDYTRNSNNSVCKLLQFENEEEKSDVICTKEQSTGKFPDIESTFKKCDVLKDMTNESFNNSNEIFESSTESLKSVSDTFSDILNKNITSEYKTEESDNILSQFISTFANSPENIKSRKIRSRDEFMTDISGLSSFLGSDDYFTCLDTHSEQQNLTDNTNNCMPLDFTKNSSISNIYEDHSRSIFNLSTEIESLGYIEINSSSDSSSLTDVEDDYSTDYIRQSLRTYGHPPGPLVPSTKRIYIRKLNRIKKKNTEHTNDDKIINILSVSYSTQLNNVLIADQNNTWEKTIKSWSTLEDSIISQKSGTSFIYLLLDPRITKNLPVQANQMNNSIIIWDTFIKAIFYIGKGSKCRPYSHMTDALNCWIEGDKEISHKAEYILNIWKEKMGVICLQAFHNLEMKEAHVRESSMINAIGLDNLTNIKQGSYFNITKWKNSEKCKLGCYLLYKAMHIFLVEGERQLKPIDLT